MRKMRQNKEKVKENEKKKSVDRAFFFASTCKNLHTFNVFEDNCQAKIIIFFASYGLKNLRCITNFDKRNKNM